MTKKSMQYKYKGTGLTAQVNGTQVVLQNCWVRCTKCDVLRPMSEVGLRTVGLNSIRSQAQCMHCRAEARRKKRDASG